MTGAQDRLATALADRYRIERELGQGGMATVYLAQDMKHDREVAFKVLKPELAAILGRERFLNEIRLTARLDHPHILTLIDSGETDGFFWYVLPFVRGESLRARLSREKQLGIEQAVAITRQIGSALEYAHQKGVIHRDIKPENILFHEGEAMLADFGIALAVKEAGGYRLTETGLSLGTPQYMSPEQATGDRDLDSRSDVYSLGAVLYEMLTGEPPHTGATVQAVIAKLMTERPTRIRTLRDTVPEEIDAAVARSLAKVPADRFASAATFVEALLQGGQPGSVRVARRRTKPILIGGVTLILLFAAGLWSLSRRLPPPPVLGRSDQLTTDPGLEIAPAISPDGKLVAYSAGNSTQMRIFIQPIGGGRTIPLSDDTAAVEAGARWSPDGASLLFLTRHGVSLAPALGGSSRPIIAGSPNAFVRSADWSPDGKEIVFSRGDSLMVVPGAGGTTRSLATGSSFHSVSWSPAGRWIAVVAGNAESVVPGNQFGNLAPSSILLVPGRGGEPVSLESGSVNQSPIWSPDGRQLYFISNRDGPRDIYAVSLAGSGRVRGRPVRLTTGLNANSISLSVDGKSLAYSVYTAQANLWSLPITSGEPVSAETAIRVTSGNQIIESVQVSPDERWLLFDSNIRGNSDIYRLALSGGPVEQLTSEPFDEFAPDLSPDGSRVAYHSWRTGTRDIEIKPLDGGPVERVTNTPEQESYPLWSPDGRAIMFVNQRVPFGLFLTQRRPDGSWSPPAQLATESSTGDWAPDGSSIAYIAAPSDNAPGPVEVVSRSGGTARRLFEPGPNAPPADRVRWSADGRTIYYKSHDARGFTSFWAVNAAGGRPRLMARFPNPDRQSNRRDFDVDRSRFYFAIEDRQSDVFVAAMIPR